MDQKIIEKILKDTELGYDLISDKFSQTRKFFWRGLEFIGDYAKKGDIVLDFGCGNGRLLEILDDNLKYWGVDVSQKLIDIAQQKYLHPVKYPQSRSAEDGFNRASFIKISPIQETLAFNDEFFNTIYSIAVFHHFPSKKYRQDWAKELYRVSRKSGRIIVTVWNLYQKNYFKNILKNWVNKLLGRSDLDWSDCYISFTDNAGNKFQRFHHAFTKSEFRNLFKKAGFKVERCEIINGRNILLVGKK